MIYKKSLREIGSLLMDCLIAMDLKQEEVGAVIAMLRTKNQRIEMLAWIKENHERKPHKTEIIEVAIAIMREITD